MAISKQRARKLCTETEYKLVEASLNLKKGEISPSDLAKKIARVRSMKDKYFDLKKSQKRSKKGEQETDSVAVRTAEKTQLFDETLQRLEKLEGAATKPRVTKKITMTRKLSEKLDAKKKSLRKNPKLDEEGELKAPNRRATKKIRPKAELAKSAAPMKKTTKKPEEKATTSNKQSAKPDKQKSTAMQKQKKAKSPVSKAPKATGSKSKNSTGDSMMKLLAKKREAEKQKQANEVTEASASKRKGTRIDMGHHKNINSHISATNKRNQAKRDAR